VNQASVGSIKFRIMLIALFGGIGFLCYLIITYNVAKENGALIKEIGAVKFPILQQVAGIRRNVVFNKDALAKLIGLEDSYYIEDADDIDSKIESSFLIVKSLENDDLKEILRIETLYYNYYVEARSLSLLLLDDANNAHKYIDRVMVLNNQYAYLLKQLEALETFYTDSYIESFALANSAQKEAIRIGLLLGGGMIFVLVIFAWTIANMVCRAVLKSELIKDEFLATISHELRTPMNGVSGSLELLKLVASDEGEIGSYIATAYDSAEEMMSLVNNLLDYTEARSGDFRPSNNRFNLKVRLALLAHCYKNKCLDKNISFNFDLKTVPDLELIGDDKRLIIILKSLLDNAVKFTEHGGISVEITVEQKNKKMYCCFRIIDSGVGIDRRHMQEIYSSFRQADGSFSRRYGGLGIGLATSTIVAKFMDGNLTFESELGVGSTFTLMIPFTKAPALGNIIPMNRQRVSGSLSGDSGADSESEKAHNQANVAAANEVEYSKLKQPIKGLLLIVEDNVVNQKVLEAMLRKLGHEVMVVENGKIALDVLEENQFDCIFMDCQMPIMDGFDATRNIRMCSKSYASIPIIAVTANAMSSDKKKCIDAGMDDYVQKPFKRQMIGFMLEKHVYDHQKGECESVSQSPR